MKNIAQKIVVFVVVVGWILSGSLYPENRKKTCEYISTSGESFFVYPDYFLSLALKEQSIASHLSMRKDAPKNKSGHEKAIEYFKKYLHCLKQTGGSPNYITYYMIAANYFEIGNLPDAMDEIEKSIALFYRFKDAYFLKARIYIRQEKIREASELLEKNISMFPEDSDMLFLLGSLFFELGNLPKAILYHKSLLDSIEKRDGESRYKVATLKSLGEIFNRSGQFRKALFYFQSYLNYEKRDIDIRYKVAQILNTLGEFGGSKRELLAILKINPNNLHVELLLGEMFFIESRAVAFPYFEKLDEEDKLKSLPLMENLFLVMTGKYSEAEKYLTEYLQKNPMRLSARLAIVEIFRKTKKYSQLSFELKKTAELAFSIKQYVLASELALELIDLWKSNPQLGGNFALAHDFLASCYEEAQSPSRAILESKKAIELAKTPIEIENFHLHLAYILRLPNVRKYEESIKIVQEVITKNPNSAYAHFLLGLNYLGLENYRKSILALSKAWELEPKNSLYVFYRGTAYDKLGDLQSTITDLKKAIELDPNNSNAHNYLGYLYLERKMDRDRALQLIKRAVELEPDNGAFQDSLGWGYYQMDRLEDAIHHLNLAVQMMTDRNETDPVVFDHLGDVYFKKNEFIVAINFWNKAIPLFQKESDKKRIYVKIQKAKKNQGQ